MSRPAISQPRQLPLDLGHVAGHSRDELVVSPANAAAVALVERWPDWPAPVVVLAGPPGSGKTHLAAIWREIAGATVVPPSALAAAAAVDVTAPLAIDDADTAGPGAESGLFHLLNAARAAGRPVLLTARRFPAAWGVRLPDLMSRLKAAATVEIGEPDDMLLAGVITKLFADRQIEVDQQTVQFLVRRMERSLATASRIVDRIDRAALETRSRITRQLAAAVLSQEDAGRGALGL